MFNRMDLSIIQDIFTNIGGKRNAGQFRIDITNFGNLLNHNWGVSQRMVAADDRGQRRPDPDQPAAGCAEAARATGWPSSTTSS